MPLSIKFWVQAYDASNDEQQKCSSNCVMTESETSEQCYWILLATSREIAIIHSYLQWIKYRTFGYIACSPRTYEVQNVGGTPNVGCMKSHEIQHMKKINVWASITFTILVIDVYISGQRESWIMLDKFWPKLHHCRARFRLMLLYRSIHGIPQWP